MPREALRIYLSNRLDSLTRSLGDEYREYEKIRRQLQDLTATAVQRPLEKPIKDSIEKAVMPHYRTREVRERQVRVLLAAVLVLLVLPSYWTPKGLIYGYFLTVFSAGSFTRSAIILTILIAAVIVAVVDRWLGVRWINPLVSRLRYRKLLWAVAITTSGLTSLALFVWFISQSQYFNSFNTSADYSIGVVSIVETVLLGFLIAIVWSWLRARAFLSDIRSGRRNVEGSATGPVQQGTRDRDAESQGR